MKRPLVFILAGALLLASCTSRRPVQTTSPPAQIGARIEQAPPTPLPTATPAPEQVAPTETPAFDEAQPVIQPQPTQIATAEPATATPEPAPTMTPDVQGFSMSSDEGPEPCPAPFWKRGRCTATQAQIEQYASEAQP
jgi:hypothetical protein